MASNQSLAKFVLGGKEKTFAYYKETQSFLLNKVTIVTNERDYGEFALIELTDGHHWIPAISSIPVLQDGLGGQDFISQMDTLRDTTIVLHGSVIGVHRRRDAFGVHLIILECSFTPTTCPRESTDPEDICFEPSVSQWLIDLRKSFTGAPDSEWFCNLFPEPSTDDYEEILNEYCIVHGDLERILVMQYGELPALHISVEEEANTSKGVKRQRSAMNEEGSISVQQPSMTAQDNTTHKRPRHDSRKDPVEPNKLTRLEQSDIALKNANAAVMEQWSEPLTIRELHKRSRGDSDKPAEDSPMVTMGNGQSSSPSPSSPPAIPTETATTNTTTTSDIPPTNTTRDVSPIHTSDISAIHTTSDIPPIHTSSNIPTIHTSSNAPPTHTTENLQSDEAAPQPSLSIVNNEDNATCQGNDETTAQISLPAVTKDNSAATQDDADEAHLYDPIPKDISAQKSILRSFYVSMTKKFKIPSLT